MFAHHRIPDQVVADNICPSQANVFVSLQGIGVLQSVSWVLDTHSLMGWVKEQFKPFKKPVKESISRSKWHLVHSSTWIQKHCYFWTKGITHTAVNEQNAEI